MRSNSFAERVLLLGRQDTEIDPDAQALFDGVVAAGDTVPDGWETAWSTFVLAAKVQGYWANFGLLAPMLSAGLTGALVAYKDGAIVSLTNMNFVEEDYTPTAGLLGDGTSKYLKSGRLDTANVVSNMSLGFVQMASSTNGQGVGIGVLSNAGPGALTRSQSVGDGANNWIGDPIDIVFTVPAGLIFSSRSGTSLTAWQNGIAVASATVNGSLTGKEIYLFCFDHSDSNAPSEYSNTTFNMFFVGMSFSEDQAAAFTSDYNAFLVGVGRPALP